MCIEIPSLPDVYWMSSYIRVPDYLMIIMIMILNDLLRHWHKLVPLSFDESSLISIFLQMIQLTSA